MRLGDFKEKERYIPLESYKVLRSYIDEENKLLNYRLTWLLSINGFLFAAYALVLGKSIDKSADVGRNVFSCVYRTYAIYADSFSVLLGGICTLGILLCMSSGSGIIAARRAINHLENFVDSEYMLTALIVPIEKKDDAVNPRIGVSHLINVPISTYNFMKSNFKRNKGKSKNFRSYFHIVYCLSVQNVGLLPFITGGGYHKPNQGLRMTALRFSRLLLIAWILSLFFTIMSNVNIHASNPDIMMFGSGNDLMCGYSLRHTKKDFGQRIHWVWRPSFRYETSETLIQ